VGDHKFKVGRPMHGPTERVGMSAVSSFAWTHRDLQEIGANYLDERSSRWMYLALAERDRKPERAELLRELAGFEEKHAAIWGNFLRKLGTRIPGDARLQEHRILVSLARIFGVGTVLPILHKGEVDGIQKYLDQARRWDDPDAQAALREILPDEVAHEVDLFGSMRRVTESRGRLRSAILGANDGLGSVLALAAGVAGATSSSPAVVIAGVAGLVAGAVSMGASNYVSVKAEQEVDASQRRLQRQAIEVAPDTKRKELVRIYEEKGLTEAEATGVASRVAERPEELAKALLSEAPAQAEETSESPGRQAAYTALAFAGAGIVPILPFLVLPALQGVLVSVALTCIALFLAGIIRALSTLHPFLRSGLEMVLIGMGAAAATYVVGYAIGVVVD
jgi:VIT1/CCC1 family predicted Fe2+/Mn2+ transporter